jgi:hypothetical protein
VSDVWDVGFDLSGPAEVRVKAQEYTARVTDASIQELFKTKRLVLLFEPMECPEAGTVLKFICEIPGSTKGKRLPQDVGVSSRYARAWIVANGGPPRRTDPMTVGVFRDGVFRIRVRDVEKGRLQHDLARPYSIVETILKRLE